ncbi:CBF/Mak21 family-domain-containing protein [Phlebopus sp. FC_14]|nr:CBF/Mak21 family-domain-containing protein [Phlebopus sp. FC_14]
MPASSLPPPSKRRKTTSDSFSLKNLESQITAAVADNTSLNPLSDLLKLTQQTSEAKELSKIIYSLYRVFVVIISNGKLVPGGGDAAKVVRRWIWERLDTYVELLVGLLQDEESSLRRSALDILFSLLRHLSTSLTKSSPPGQPQFHFSHFKRIVHGLLICPPSFRSHQDILREGRTAPDVRDHFVETWFTVHDDIRWCFLREATYLLSKFSGAEHSNMLANLLTIMEKLTTFPTEPSELNAWWIQELGKRPPQPKGARIDGDDAQDEDIGNDAQEDQEDDWRKFFDEEPTANDVKKTAAVRGRAHQLTFHQSLHSLQAHRAVFTKMWLSFLPLLSSTSSGANREFTIRALNIMHRGVLPHLTRPILVMDWVSACVDYGGSVGLLALNALFALMKDYNLDYPSFYPRLYAFLDRDVLHLKHRARFFRLTEVFLSSTHLPATLLASFVKRLSRLSLTSPPAAIIMIIPFTYNILKRHPSLMPMIHNPLDASDSFIDPFLPDEVNPNTTNAMDSSLWELYSHKYHYDSAVSTLARIFEEAFTKPGYAMEDFLDHTYGTMIEAEMKRKIKKEPALAMELVKTPFPTCLGDGEDNAGEGDAVSGLWIFV